MKYPCRGRVTPLSASVAYMLCVIDWAVLVNETLRAFALLAIVAPLHAAPRPAILASEGTAHMPVVISDKASPRVRDAASTLTNTLHRISGTEFEITTGDGSAGIVMGLPNEFPGLPFKPKFESGPFNREQYTLRSRKKGLWIIGVTDLAVEHAVWDLLYRLGYRQFFPGATWEIVPSLKEIAIAVEVDEEPDFYARRIWYNWGTTAYNRKPYAAWCARNRALKGFDLNSGHSYGGIIAANKEEFDAHPEYLALVNGTRKRGGDAKFCVSNPGLRELVVEHARQRVRRNPAVDSISMDPSDGGGWCECAACKKMGGVSDRVLTLANEVATAINALGLGNKYVGMYAYNKHCAPPGIKVHSNVIVSVTTAFLTGGWTFDRIVEGWQKQGATIGVYDYFTVIAWDWNRPRGARSSKPKGLAASIRKYHVQGARFLDAESGDAWGPYGLGFYVAARTLWDVDEADRVDAIVEDFLTKAFGPAKVPMAEFYKLITVDSKRRSSADILARMYRYLDKARTLAANAPDVLRRIDDLLLYTRYVEIYEAFASAAGKSREAAKNDVLRHAYRMRKTMMVHTYGIWARLASQNAMNRRDHVAISDEPFREDEIVKILRFGLANNKPVDMDFDAIEFSTILVPASHALGLPTVEQGSYPTQPQDRQNYYIWVDKAPAKIHLKVTTTHRWNLRPHKITLFSPKDVYVKEVDSSDIVKPDGKQYDVILNTPYDGLHRIQIRDGGDFTRIIWPDGMPVTLPGSESTQGVKNHFRGPWTLYFYVPKGTKTVAGWAERIANWAPRISGTLQDSTGKSLYDFSKVNDAWFVVPVPEGQDGKIWRFKNTHGVRYLMTVPPYFARTTEDLLLPREVVETDAKK